MPKSIDNKQVYTVSQLNIEARQVLESSFPLIWVEGEISNFSAPRSGHIYFSLKDSHSQTRCAMFRMKRQLLRFTPENGLKVLLRARITLYEARGDFQLVVEHMEQAGEGQLRQAIEQLKLKLKTEGLFENIHKKDIPLLPQTVGVITSPSGAAITDVLNIFKRRFPAIRIIIYPVQVQGENAASEITQMLKIADQRNECDLLILTRGGGSLEDLMAFNDEEMARTIFAINTPIISAVGHEIDTSISDFVADRRAPTPSAAAELASPDQEHIEDSIRKLLQRLKQQNNTTLKNEQSLFKNLEQRLLIQSPEKQLQNKSQAIDHLENRLNQATKQIIQSNQKTHKDLVNRLSLLSPDHKISQFKIRYENLSQRLEHSIKRELSILKEKLQSHSRVLESVSPLATISRGYAIVKDKNNLIIRNIDDVNVGDKIVTQLSNGNLSCTVDSKKS